MASEKKVVLFFSTFTYKILQECAESNVQKFFTKSAILKNITDNNVNQAASGNIEGETLWDAAKRYELELAAATEDFDICVYQNMNDLQKLNSALDLLFEKAPRSTLYVLLAQDCMLYYGLGIDKGKVIDKPYCACTLAPTVAYIADFPLPENCSAPICYEVLKDKNFKYKEIVKFQTTIKNLEAAIERGGRRPWDKHDCA